MLRGQSLADAYRDAYIKEVSQVSGVPAEKIHIYAAYQGGGWIEIWGHDIPSHKDLRYMCRNGWSLGDKVRCSEARRFLNPTEVEA